MKKTTRLRLTLPEATLLSDYLTYSYFPLRFANSPCQYVFATPMDSHLPEDRRLRVDIGKLCTKLDHAALRLREKSQQP